MKTYEPAPKPSAIRSVFFQKRAVEIRFVDDVQVVELAAEVGPVAVAPDGEVGRAHLVGMCEWVLMGVNGWTVGMWKAG